MIFQDRRDIRQAVIFRNNESVYRRQIGDKEFTLDWTDTKPSDEELLRYYARFQAVDEELAWPRPIWFAQ